MFKLLIFVFRLLDQRKLRNKELEVLAEQNPPTQLEETTAMMRALASIDPISTVTAAPRNSQARKSRPKIRSGHKSKVRHQSEPSTCQQTPKPRMHNVDTAQQKAKSSAKNTQQTAQRVKLAAKNAQQQGRSKSLNSKKTGRRLRRKDSEIKDGDYEEKHCVEYFEEK
jgi:hypothetical protein